MHIFLSLSILLCVLCFHLCAAQLNYVSTPQGYVRSDCLHKISNQHHVREVAGRLHVLSKEDDSLVRTLPKCVDESNLPVWQTFRARDIHGQDRKLLQFPPDYDGWTAYVAYNAPGGIDAMLNYFSVPATNPINPPDILYLFPGLQNIDWIPLRDPNPDGFDIIQPVLQYPADDGVGWSVKSWYVTLDDGALQSDEIAINNSDAIYGNMTQTGTDTWFIGSTVRSNNQLTSLTVSRPRLTNQYWAYNTIECYGCQDCTTYPGNNSPSFFTQLQLFKNNVQLTPNWLLNPKNNPTKFCQETVKIQDPETLALVFSSSSSDEQQEAIIIEQQ